MRDLSRIVKAYDVRGVVPDEFDADVARAMGAAFAIFTDAPDIVIARDMRASGVELCAAFAAGVTAQGVNVVDAGLASTDLLYYASGALTLPGAMFTASHNPAQYNGIKLCLAGAAPVGQDTGLAELRAMIEKWGDEGPPAYDGPHGEILDRDLLSGYAHHLRELVDISANRQLTVVVDAGNGMGGHTVPSVFDGLPVSLIPLYFELDGSFPHHEANPIDPANLVDLQRAVLAHRADVGLAFDGDADRCFVVDERGELVNPSTLTALIAARELAKEPGATIIHNVITSRYVPELVASLGGTPVRARVGHSFIKAEMASTGAVFGGEHSGHFYFREFWNADSGMLAALHTLDALGEQAGPLSGLLATYTPYAMSGEINSTVPDAAAATDVVLGAFEARPGVMVDSLDGVTVSLPDGSWFNVRASNTEPLLRLNVEAADLPTMTALRDEVLALIRG